MISDWLLFLALAAPPYELWRKQILEILHVPRPLPALDTQQYGRSQAEPGVVVERVSYSTQLGMRVPAIVYRPGRAAGRRPALIVVNGHGGDKYAWYANYSGIAYARLGFVVLTYDPAGEGERNSERKSGTRAHDRVVPPEEIGRWLGGLMMTDVMMAVSYLSSRADVDSSRISAAGYSMGSFVLSLALRSRRDSGRAYLPAEETWMVPVSTGTGRSPCARAFHIARWGFWEIVRRRSMRCMRNADRHWSTTVWKIRLSQFPRIVKTSLLICGSVLWRSAAGPRTCSKRSLSKE